MPHKLITRTCPWCGSTFEIEPYKRTRHCSIACANNANGNPNGVDARFWGYVSGTDKPDGCWEWTGTLSKAGYGKFRALGKMWLAHRYAYVTNKGDLVEGLMLDHLCRNPRCVNPAHLEQVTPFVNAYRGNAPVMVTFKTDVCQRGHRLTPDNVYTFVGRNGKTYRNCRTCTNAGQRRRYQERKQQES